MPFGLRDAAQIFQRFIDEVLRDLHFSYAYIDNVLIASSNPQEHKQHLKQVFDRFKQVGVIVNPTKCQFGVSELTFLGHSLNSQGICPLQDKVIVIQEFPQPSTRCKLREFLGLVNFYQCFIPHCADILQLLHTLLASAHNNHNILQLNEESLQAFSKITQAIADVSLLSHPHTDIPTHIAFFSKKLKPAETRYRTFDCELLAMYLAIKHFQHFVEYRQFHVITDHKPLTFTQSSKLTPSQIRHLDFISQFTTDVRHIKGSDNAVADALSRIEANALHSDSADAVFPPTVDFKDVTAAQKHDTEFQQLQSSSTSLQLQSVPLPTSNISLVCDMSTGVPRPYIPSELRRTVFDALHSLSHPDVRAIQRLITAHYVWPKIKSDTRKCAQTCLKCQ